MACYLDVKLKHIGRIKKFRKIFLRTLLVIFLLLAGLVILISNPVVQTYIANRVTKNINEKYDTNISINRIGLDWDGDILLKELYVADHFGDTLIYTKTLESSIASFKQAYNGDLEFSEVEFTQLKFFLTTYSNEVDDNLTQFLEKFETDQPASSEPFLLQAEGVVINDGYIRIKDENLETPLMFDLQDFGLETYDFVIQEDEVSTVIESLRFNERNNLCVNHLSGIFSYTSDRMVIADLELLSGFSEVYADVTLDYPNGLGNFINNVIITAQFDPSVISTNDLQAFYSEFGDNGSIKLTGEFNGSLNDFNFNKTNLQYYNTRITGNFKGTDLLNDESDFKIVGANHRIATSYYDLKRFLPRVLKELPVELTTLGVFNVNGNSTITPNTLAADVIIETGLGDAQTQLTMGNMTQIELATYVGDITFSDFDLGTFVGTSVIGNLNGDLVFNGKGFTVETVKSSVAGKLTALEVQGYTYKDVMLSGNLEQPQFNGNFTINDPNLKMDFDGLIDVSEAINRYDFEARVDYADLHRLNLIQRDSISIFTGSILMDMTGTTVDNAVGSIEFKETTYQNLEDDYYFDDLIVEANFIDLEREIKIISPDVINGRLIGRFNIIDLPNLFRNGVGSIYANYIPKDVTTNQYLDYEFEVFNKIVDVFVPEIKLGENSRVDGSVSSDESEFKLNFKSPELLIYDNYLSKVNLKVDNDNPLFNTFIDIDSLDAGFYDFNDINLINVTVNDTLFIRSQFVGGIDNTDKYNLSLYHTINQEGKSVVGVKKSTIEFKENVWYVNKDNNRLNNIVFDNNFKDITVNALTMNHNKEYIQLAGFLQGDNYKDLAIEFIDVDIGKITPPVENLELTGTVNGRLNFLQKDGAYYPDSNVSIEGITMNNTRYGDLLLSVAGNEDLTLYNVNTTLTNKNVESIRAIGTIDLRPNEPQIDLDVDLNSLNLEALTPFGTDVITNIRGFVSGKTSVRGNYKSPDLFGKIALDKSGLTIPYLNIDYAFADNAEVFIAKNKFTLSNIPITDTRFESGGILSGFVTHQDFAQWDLNLKVESDNLLVLNTPQEEEALYYGTAFIRGEASISGKTEALVIDVLATTQPNTVFKIPISDVEALGEEGYIHFLSPEEKEARLNGEIITQEALSGLTLNFELDINQNAEVEVVVDQKSGSTLNGRGAGTLLIEINTLGKFKMWGDFIVIDGLYDFKFQSLINRTIAVDPGGTITWDGDPTRANLNIKARYNTNANPSVLLDNPSVNQEIEVDAVVELTGEILKPNIDFFVEFPNANNNVSRELTDKLRTKEQREQQAIFLLALGQFQGNAGGGIGAGAGASVLSSSVGNILNDLLSDEDGRLNVSVIYDVSERRPDVETSDRFITTISTQVSDRILINGKVGIPVGGVTDTQVAGDIEIQWLINEDGTLRMNFFNRQAQIQFIGEELNFEQGAGIQYSVDFDTFQELVSKLFNKKIELEANSNVNIVPDDSDIGPVNFKSKKDGTKN